MHPDGKEKVVAEESDLLRCALGGFTKAVPQDLRRRHETADVSFPLTNLLLPVLNSQQVGLRSSYAWNCQLLPLLGGTQPKGRVCV